MTNKVATKPKQQEAIGLPQALFTIPLWWEKVLTQALSDEEFMDEKNVTLQGIYLQGRS